MLFYSRPPLCLISLALKPRSPKSPKRVVRRFDEDSMAFIMELLDNHELLQKHLFQACSWCLGVYGLGSRLRAWAAGPLKFF